MKCSLVAFSRITYNPSLQLIYNFIIEKEKNHNKIGIKLKKFTDEKIQKKSKEIVKKLSNNCDNN